MSAVILCGGLGTRLREETEFKPKPMVDIGGKPILWHIMKTYAAFGVSKFILCLGYRGEVIRQYFRNYALDQGNIKVNLRSNTVTFLDRGDIEDWEVTLVDTGALTMTGGRLLQASKYIEGDSFFLTYGDGVADIDINALWSFHKSHGMGATVTGVHPSSRFGEIDESGGRVVGFREKPQTDDGWINGGFFVMDKAVLNGFEYRSDSVLENDILPVLAKQHRLGIYKHGGFWQCMDTYREMQLLNAMCENQTPPWLAVGS
ncbi:MAG: glucose-1-phosphate cytidylyltransferase [Alphaproteobacteria bacterium]|nr:glucose-1-phosphate cytidylyltransferase [Alphaproteobacteria bacterium]